MRLYLIRHGETELNQRGCYYGITDAGLNPSGIEQAELLAKALREITFDKVIVSPLRRAVDTASLICPDKKYEMQTEERLQEQHFGIFEGMTAKEIMESYPEEWKEWNGNFYEHRISGGESFKDVRERIDSWVQEQGEQKENVLVVAHKGTLGHLLASLLHLPLEGYWHFVFEQGCYNIVDLEDGYAIIRGLNIPA